MGIAFDTLAYAKRLQAAGFTQAQAEVQAEALAEIVDERLATKQDLREQEQRLLSRMEQIEYKLTLRLGAMIVAAVGVMATLVKIL
jgi:coproporphyrinogen III oxidase